ncbi:MAG: response regulator [Methylococcaceae bacterium]
MSLFKSKKKSFLTPNEVAELMMVAPVTVRSWAQKGLLAAKVTPGGHRRFLKSEVERFMRDSGFVPGEDEIKPSAPRVLIVDDDPVMTTYLQGIIEDFDTSFVTEIALTGFEAGTKIHTFLPDVVLLDLMLPDIDGFKICSLIKNEAATRHIRVIAISGNTSTQNVSRILEAGAENCLAKPFDPENIVKILSTAVDVKKMTVRIS